MNIKPLSDNIIVKQFKEEQVSKGGIVIPDNVQEKPHKGTVISVGDGRFADNGERIPMTLKACDEVLFAKYTGNEVTIDGKDYIIMKEEDVLAIL